MKNTHIKFTQRKEKDESKGDIHKVILSGQDQSVSTDLTSCDLQFLLIHNITFEKKTHLTDENNNIPFSYFCLT